MSNKAITPYCPVLLRLHSLLMSNIFDFNFMGSDFYDTIKTAIKNNKNNKPLLVGVKKYGVVFFIAKATFETYLESEDPSLHYIPYNCNEGILSDIDLLIGLIEYHNLNEYKPYKKLISFLKKIDSKYETNENFYFGFLDRHQHLIKNMFISACYYLSNQIAPLKESYLCSLVNRILFDREMCKFITQRLMESGYSKYDFDKHNGRPGRNSPWVKELLNKRDTKCALCGKNTAKTIDHIIPLANGGFNDVINFQLTCPKCNQEKGCGYDCNTSYPSFYQHIPSRR